MRFIPILLIVAGLYMAVVKPWFSTTLTGEELAQTQVYDRANTTGGARGWNVSTVFLEKENSPAIIRIKVSRLPGQHYDNGKLKLLVRLAPISQDGTAGQTIVNEAVTINLETGNSGNSTTQAQEISVISTSEFEVPRTGNYKIGAFPISSNNASNGNPDLEIDRNITGISAIVMSGVEPVGKSNAILGFALIAVGLALMSIFKRRKRRRKAAGPLAPPPARVEPDDQSEEITSSVKEKPAPESDPVPPSSNVGKTIKWGRDAGKNK